MTRAEFSSLYLQSNQGVDYTPLGPKLERRRVANLCGMTGQLEASGLAHALATPTRLTEAEMTALGDTPGRDRADSTEQLQQRCARKAPPTAPKSAHLARVHSVADAMDFAEGALAVAAGKTPREAIQFPSQDESHEEEEDDDDGDGSTEDGGEPPEMAAGGGELSLASILAGDAEGDAPKQVGAAGDAASEDVERLIEGL